MLYCGQERSFAAVRIRVHSENMDSFCNSWRMLVTLVVSRNYSLKADVMALSVCRAAACTGQEILSHFFPCCLDSSSSWWYSRGRSVVFPVSAHMVDFLLFYNLTIQCAAMCTVYCIFNPFPIPPENPLVILRETHHINPRVNCIPLEYRILLLFKLFT